MRTAIQLLEENKMLDSYQVIEKAIMDFFNENPDILMGDVFDHDRYQKLIGGKSFEEMMREDDELEVPGSLDSSNDNLEEDEEKMPDDSDIPLQNSVPTAEECISEIKFILSERGDEAALRTAIELLEENKTLDSYPVIENAIIDFFNKNLYILMRDVFSYNRYQKLIGGKSFEEMMRECNELEVIEILDSPNDNEDDELEALGSLDSPNDFE